MSVNPFKRVCLKPAELYLLIQYDHMLWTLCDIVEKLQRELLKQRDERLKAANCAVLMGLILGSTRAKMIRNVKKLGYNENYAEKFVDEIIGKYSDLSKRSEAGFFVGVEPQPIKKGEWGKPGSRQPKPGRPPREYKLEFPSPPPNKRTEELTYLVSLLSGSLIRLTKIIMRMYEEPKMREVLVQHACKMLRIPSAKIEKSLKINDIEKQIDDQYNQLLEPILKDVSRILSLKSENR